MRSHAQLMVDPDAPSPEDPIFSQWLHWIVDDIPNGALRKPLSESLMAAHLECMSQVLTTGSGKMQCFLRHACVLPTCWPKLRFVLANAPACESAFLRDVCDYVLQG